MGKAILAMFGLPGGVEWIVILVVGLLLFGRRLPEVARSVGKSIVEFKKGMKDVKDEIDDASREEPKQQRLETKRPDALSSTSEQPQHTESRPD